MSTNDVWSLPRDRAREIIEKYRTDFPGAPMPTEDDRRAVNPRER